jgi:hypothetical protein
MNLLRFSGEALGSIYSQLFELYKAGVGERQVAPTAPVEAIDVMGDGVNAGVVGQSD